MKHQAASVPFELAIRAAAGSTVSPYLLKPGQMQSTEG